jgi:mannitol-1-/sugar-/sorbitol-6-/2-deoxyglucose-6-phosphatase
MKRIEAVVFDMDGVLIDSEVLWRQVREEFAADLGKTWDSQDQASTMGANTATWARVMFERLQLRDLPGMDAAAVARDIIVRMIAKYRAHLPVRVGAIDAVHEAARHYKVALATGSPRELANYVLLATGLDRVFEATLYGDDVAHGKPAPDIYWGALDRIGVRPERAVGVEDSGNGIRSLRAAGMGIIAAPSPEFPLSAEVLALVDAHIAEMSEFSAALVERAGARLKEP